MQEFQTKHPRSGVSSLFLLNTKEERKPGESLMYEVLTMQQETRSWFIDNNVVSDGNVYICTPLDPLFLILPALVQSEKAKPLEDHLYEGSLPRVVADAVSKRLPHEELEKVSNKKEFDDLVVFSYSEEKTLAWLTKKAERVSRFLTEKKISHAEASISSNFTKSSFDTVSKADTLRYACDIIGEYLDDNLKKKLLQSLGLPVVQEKTGVKRKGDVADEDETTNKKIKNEDGKPLEDYGSASPLINPNKNVKVTAKEKEFKKAAHGTPSLLKFFAPKSK